jgi:hypothetical protein
MEYFHIFPIADDPTKYELNDAERSRDRIATSYLPLHLPCFWKK